MKTITIDRTFGSGGREIALQLSQKTGVPFFDNEIILKAAEDFGVDVGLLRNYDENYVGSLIYNLSMFSTTGDYEQSAIYRTYFAVSEAMRRLCKEHEGGIFLGRCADVILADLRPILRTFIYSSSMEMRIDRTVSLEDVSRAKAETFIQRKDKQRRNYYQFFTDNKWSASVNYDIMLNTASIDYDKCADIIIALADLS
ncbi:MAG: cytidylate kinase-like family protein [Clostridia bacterium]|nr:cytidylate kinase-like family protein [Clostridia bacterium]